MLVVETEKVAIDVPAPASGILAGICAQEGEVVPIAQVIAYILKEGESLADLERAETPASIHTVNATPVARRMAKELDVDLTQVNATTERITRSDVERYIAGNPAPAGRVAVAATPAARRLARERGINIRDLSGSGPRGRIQAGDIPGTAAAEVPERDRALDKLARVERPAKIIPMAGMRRTIAERMQASFHDAPHIALSIEADVTHLQETRSRLNSFADRQGYGKVTLTALLVRIVAWALKQQPALNASLIGEQIHVWEDINIGVATALPDGLIVPVIQQANYKTIGEIAAALQDLTARAKEGKLSLADVQHGTFTISNLGMFGIQQFRAIINPPESAILAVGAVTRKPVVINERDEVGVRPMVSLTLAADHRIVDGATAARFLANILQTVEAPDILLY